MTLKRYRFADDFFYNMNDDLAVFDNFFSHPITTRLSVFNERDYDLVPKKHTIEKKIKEAEQRLDSLKERKENYERQYEEEVKALKLEIEQMKQKLI
jgi:hypothetical protein